MEYQSGGQHSAIYVKDKKVLCTMLSIFLYICYHSKLFNMKEKLQKICNSTREEYIYRQHRMEFVENPKWMGGRDGKTTKDNTSEEPNIQNNQSGISKKNTFS